MTRIRILIVDDEVHARRGLQALLADEPDVEVVAEAASGPDAVEKIRECKPDLVLLDVQMPGYSGLDVVAEVGADAMPLVIFCTAYDEYAIAAFEAHALDYLLKPFTDERFHVALARARTSLREHSDRSVSEQLARLVDARSAGTVDRFTVRVGDSLQVFRVDQIDWIEADEYYAKLHIGGHAHMVKQTMGALEERLPPDRFVRIHRSTIVNVDRIAALQPLFQGDFSVVLHDGTALRMSRRRREALGQRLPTLS